MRKRQSESNYRLQDGLFAGQAPVQVDSRHNLSATQLGSRTGAPHPLWADLFMGDRAPWQCNGGTDFVYF